MEDFIAAGGGDPHFGMRLPEMLFAAGLENVGFAVRMPPNNGQTMLDHLEGIADRLVANERFTLNEIGRLEDFLHNERVVLHSTTVVAAWGRTPKPI